MDSRNEMTDLRLAAVAMHEMFVELKAAGFSVKEALRLVAIMAETGATEPPPEQQ